MFPLNVRSYAGNISGKCKTFICNKALKMGKSTLFIPAKCWQVFVVFYHGVFNVRKPRYIVERQAVVHVSIEATIHAVAKPIYHLWDKICRHCYNKRVD